MNASAKQTESARGPLRWVLLHHRLSTPPPDESAISSHLAARGDHFDWMFEWDNNPSTLLWTFATPVIDWLARLDQWRSDGRSIELPTVRLPDHRRRYLEYQGEISGNRGAVTQVVTGTHQPSTHQPSTHQPSTHQPSTHQASTTDNVGARFETSIRWQPSSSQTISSAQITFHIHSHHNDAASDVSRYKRGNTWEGRVVLCPSWK